MSSPDSALAVRLAEAGDLSEIRELGRRTLDASCRPITGAAYARHVYETWWSPQALRSSLERSTNLLAVLEGEIVGVAALGERDGVPVIWKFYVLPEHQGRGVGSHLLSEAEAALPHGASTLTLAYVDGNDSAAAFYQAHGFREFARETDSDGWLDQIWMTKQLNAGA